MIALFSAKELMRNVFFIPSGEKEADTRVVIPVKDTRIDLKKVLSVARSMEGKPYKPGGANPEGFDCSGFIGYVFRKGGFQLPRSSEAMAGVGIKVNRHEVLPGDLLFFMGSNLEEPKIGHVALVLEKSGSSISMIHAGNRGVVVDKLEDMNYYLKRYLGATRPYIN